MKRLRRYIAVIICFVLLFTTSGFAFANGTSLSEESLVEKSLLANMDANNVTKKIIGSKEDFSVKGEGFYLKMPIDSSEEMGVELQAKTNVKIKLPKSLYMNGKTVNDKIVVYDAMFENYSVAFQVEDREINQVCFDEVKMSIVLMNENAPESYIFTYEIPQNWELISIEDYVFKYAKENEKEMLGTTKNVVLILDENKEISHTIDGFEGKDNSGKSFEVDYNVEGNSLTIIPITDESNSYPVVVYSTTHPDYDKTVYLNKDEVESVRDRYSGSSLDTLVSGLAGLGIAYLDNPTGVVYTIVSIAITVYEQYTYETWNTFYKTLKNSTYYRYLRVVTTYHYHPGKRCYYPQNCDYAYVREKKA